MKKTTPKNIWTPHSWQKKNAVQQPVYPNTKELKKIISDLIELPPLVTPIEVETLKKQLASAAQGKSFLLQAGDCAESFADCRAINITNKLKILLQMSLILLHGLQKPIIRVGRMAGQYAKPRSSDIETQNNISLPSYRGDIINQPHFSAEARTPDPNLLLQGYYYSALTLNYLRALVAGGFANLLHPEFWHLDFVENSRMANKYQNIVDSIGNSLSFLKTIAGLQTASLYSVDFYTSHEALHLLYEETLTRQDNNGRWYNLSTHFPWIGMRTTQLDGAHVEYFRGIANPIAVKVGPSMTAEHLTELIHILNPNDEPGRLTLIHRLGVENVEKKLPELIKTVQKTGKTVLWLCDPMHGNTRTTKDGIKTRHFEDISKELQLSFEIHQKMKSYLGGIHIELTGENVTECIGGTSGLKESDLTRAYTSLVDPRLNYEQALEIAMLVAGKK